jgi:hypothetical protein
LGGCTSISIEPTCPEELAVGESGTVRANEKNPGAIATYLWEVFPPDAGVFDDPTAPNARFTATREIDVVLHLTASDGLYQVISSCGIRIRGAVDLAVAFVADPNPIALGETTVLFCSSVGTTEAASLTLSQVDGTDAVLAPLADGVATFTPDRTGEFDFQCVAASADGAESQPARVTVNVNAAANENDNENDNGGRQPPRPGRT